MIDLSDPNTDVESDYKRFRRYWRGRYPAVEWLFTEQDVADWVYGPEELPKSERKSRTLSDAVDTAEKLISVWEMADLIVPYSRVSYRLRLI